MLRVMILSCVLSCSAVVASGALSAHAPDARAPKSRAPQSIMPEVQVPEIPAPDAALPAAPQKPSGQSKPGSEAKQLDAMSPLNALHDQRVWSQIRIEQRVVVRISPQRPSNRQNLLAQLPQRALNSRFEERDMGECVPVAGIAGVQTGSGNRLLLFMRDSKIMSLNLEKACRARDFYSGFYVERAEDGNLCIDRDKLQARNGAKCEVSRLRQLVAVSE